MLAAALASLPRVKLASVKPTPLEPLPRLSDVLGGPPLYIKRDDLTGLAFGGNKTGWSRSIRDRLIPSSCWPTSA